MKAIDILVSIFLICVGFILYFIVTINLEGFMYTAAIADVVGVTAVIMNLFFGKELSSKKLPTNI